MLRLYWLSIFASIALAGITPGVVDEVNSHGWWQVSHTAEDWQDLSYWTSVDVDITRLFCPVKHWHTLAIGEEAFSHRCVAQGLENVESSRWLPMWTLSRPPTIHWRVWIYQEGFLTVATSHTAAFCKAVEQGVKPDLETTAVDMKQDPGLQHLCTKEWSFVKPVPSWCNSAAWLGPVGRWSLQWPVLQASMANSFCKPLWLLQASQRVESFIAMHACGRLRQDLWDAWRRYDEGHCFPGAEGLYLFFYRCECCNVAGPDWKYVHVFSTRLLRGWKENNNEIVVALQQSPQLSWQGQIVRGWSKPIEEASGRMWAACLQALFLLHCLQALFASFALFCFHFTCRQIVKKQGAYFSQPMCTRVQREVSPLAWSRLISSKHNGHTWKMSMAWKRHVQGKVCAHYVVAGNFALLSRCISAHRSHQCAT